MCIVIYIDATPRDQMSFVDEIRREISQLSAEPDAAKAPNEPTTQEPAPKDDEPVEPEAPEETPKDNVEPEAPEETPKDDEPVDAKAPEDPPIVRSPTPDSPKRALSSIVEDFKFFELLYGHYPEEAAAVFSSVGELRNALRAFRDKAQS